MKIALHRIQCCTRQYSIFNVQLNIASENWKYMCSIAFEGLPEWGFYHFSTFSAYALETFVFPLFLKKIRGVRFLPDIWIKSTWHRDPACSLCARNLWFPLFWKRIRGAPFLPDIWIKSTWHRDSACSLCVRNVCSPTVLEGNQGGAVFTWHLDQIYLTSGFRLQPTRVQGR